MGNKRRDRQSVREDPIRGAGRSDRLEEKRRRFAEEDRGSRSLSPTVYVTVGVIVLAVIFVAAMTLRNSGPAAAAPTAAGAPAGGAASAGVLQQVAASTSFTEAGKVGITVQEVKDNKLVAWDYKQGSVTIPLIAYVTPSGAVKISIRMCEPCNSRSFRIEGNQIVCNSCGTRWDLETSKGISGGCQGYPPDVLPGTIADGKITVDETKVSTWKPRV